MATDEQARERAVGAFLLLAAVCFALLIGWVGYGGAWLTPRYEYTLVLDSGTGLTPGVEVTVAGLRVGRVQAVQLTQDRRVALLLSVEQRYADFVKVDSEGNATVTLQGKVVEIGPGSPGAAVMAPGGMLVSGRNVDPLEVLSELDLGETLDRLQMVLGDIERLADQLRLGDGEVPETLDRLVGLVERMDRGEGAIGRLVADDSLLDDVQATTEALTRMAGSLEGTAAAMEKSATGLDAAVTDVASVTRELTGTTEDISKASLAVADGAGSMSSAMSGLPATLDNLNASLVELEKTLRAIQGLPLVKGQVKKIEQE